MIPSYLTAALREYCDWIHAHAVLAQNAAGPEARTYDGKPTTWLDHCGQARERPLVEAAMRAGIWSTDDYGEDIFA